MRDGAFRESPCTGLIREQHLFLGQTRLDGKGAGEGRNSSDQVVRNRISPGDIRSLTHLALME